MGYFCHHYIKPASGRNNNEKVNPEKDSIKNSRSINFITDNVKSGVITNYGYTAFSDEEGFWYQNYNNTNKLIDTLDGRTTDLRLTLVNVYDRPLKDVADIKVIMLIADDNVRRGRTIGVIVIVLVVLLICCGLYRWKKLRANGIPG